MLLISSIETIGIAAIMPFISIATDFSVIESNGYYNAIFNFFSFDSQLDFVVAFGIVLIFFYFFRSLLNIYYSYKSAEFYHGKYYRTAVQLFSTYMDMTYENFMSKNTSFLTKSIISETQMLSNMLHSALSAATEIMVFIFIFAVFVVIDYEVTIALTAFLALLSLTMFKLISNTIKQKGSERAESQAKFYEAISKGFGNYKVLKIDSNRDRLTKEFENIGESYSRALVADSVLNGLPRSILEAVSFSIVVIMVLYVVMTSSSASDAGYSIGVMSVFILGLYRLMPSINRIISGFNTVAFHHKALQIIIKELDVDIELPGCDPIDFQHKIEFRDVSFRYGSGQRILKNINFTISKGERVAFIGDSGCGKSTLVDVLIGILTPESGDILIDGVPVSADNMATWRDKIGYIPQDVHLFDGSVCENVALNSNINEKRVSSVLKKAKIWDFLLTQDGINTKVGDKGVMLSGGQKQRIGIARALYKKPEVLVLDEATSALDASKEKKIMSEIYKVASSQTLIVVAHRLNTIVECDSIYKISEGRLHRVKHDEIG